MMARETSPFKPREVRDGREKREVDRVSFYRGRAHLSCPVMYVPLRGDFYTLEIVGYAGCR